MKQTQSYTCTASETHRERERVGKARRGQRQRKRKRKYDTIKLFNQIPAECCCCQNEKNAMRCAFVRMHEPLQVLLTSFINNKLLDIKRYRNCSKIIGRHKYYCDIDKHTGRNVWSMFFHRCNLIRFNVHSNGITTAMGKAKYYTRAHFHIFPFITNENCSPTVPAV